MYTNLEYLLVGCLLQSHMDKPSVHKSCYQNGTADQKDYNQHECEEGTKSSIFPLPFYQNLRYACWEGDVGY